MVTQLVAGRVFDFSRVVGRSAASGIGFTQPVAVAIGGGDLVYVLSRGWEQNANVPWNRTQAGIRVGMLTIGDQPWDEEFVGDFSKAGDAPGEFIWPAGMALDSRGNVYVTDEWLNRVSIFDSQGNFQDMWGSQGTNEGQFQGPSGIAVGQDDELYVVDSRNHRVQKFSKNGGFLAQWGGLGAAAGQLDSPWGITVDHQGDVYVADHKNHRVQKFSPDGRPMAKFGSYGTGRGQLNRPSDVAVDPDGDVYACDWANHRVQVFGPDGRFVTSFRGDAQELSKWAKMALDANPDAAKRRREVPDLEVEWRFSFPTGIAFDAVKNRLFVTDCQRGRLQIYNKLKDYKQPARTI